MHASRYLRQELGERLRRARQRKGLTQIAVGALLATDQSTICRIEGGQAPRPELAGRIEAFIRDAEVLSGQETSKVALAVAESDELRALIARIAAEL